ncbi:hypothetical protein ACQ4LE_005469 [Meloidogyne hapla]
MFITKRIFVLLSLQLIPNIVSAQWALVYNGALVDKKDQPVVTGDKQNTDASSSTNNFMCLIVFCPAGDGYSNPAYAGYGYSYSNPGYAYSSAYYPNNYGYSSYGSSNYYCYYSPSYCYGYGSGYYGK